MKKRALLALLLLSTGSSYYGGASYLPLLMERTELEQSIRMTTTPVPIQQPGRLYRYQHWLLFVEQYKGIHLVDNSDPTKPIRKAFLRIPGCQNLTIGNRVLYVDNAVDLVGIRLDLNTLSAVELARSRKVLPEIVNPDGYIPYDYTRTNRPENTEIVGWINKTDL